MHFEADERHVLFLYIAKRPTDSRFGIGDRGGVEAAVRSDFQQRVAFGAGDMSDDLVAVTPAEDLRPGRGFTDEAATGANGCEAAFGREPIIGLNPRSRDSHGGFAQRVQEVAAFVVFVRTSTANRHGPR